MLKVQLSEINRSWAEYGVRHPALRKAVIFGFVIALVFLVLGGLAPRVGFESLGSMINDKETVGKVG